MIIPTQSQVQMFNNLNRSMNEIPKTNHVPQNTSTPVK